MSFTIATCNTTTYQGLQRWLGDEKCDPDMCMLQELHPRGEDQVAQLQQWAGREGYKTHIAPSLPGVGTGTRAGVGIFARAHLGLTAHHACPSSVAMAGHLVTGHFTAMGGVGITLLSAYFQPGIALGFENAELMRRIAYPVAAASAEWIVCADFNNPPDSLQAFAASIGGGGGARRAAHAGLGIGIYAHRLWDRVQGASRTPAGGHGRRRGMHQATQAGVASLQA